MYSKRGDEVWFIHPDRGQKLDKLPPKTYTVKVTDLGEYYLKEVDDLVVACKIYGTLNRNADRIFNTYQSRSSNMGILLAGVKGSGKTLLTRQLCTMGRTKDMPTIMVEAPYYGSSFNMFIQAIKQPAIVMFDEFEKVYVQRRDATEGGPQSILLSLFDGSYASNKLFVLTVNESNYVNSNMINRPGRMFYMLNFSHLDKATVREFANDKLNDKSKADDLVKLSCYIPLTFDTLSALVDEMNRYEEGVLDALKFLNIKVEAGSTQFYTVEIKPKSNSNVFWCMPYRSRDSISLTQGHNFTIYNMTKVEHTEAVNNFKKLHKKMPVDTELRGYSEVADVYLEWNNITNIDEKGVVSMSSDRFDIKLIPDFHDTKFSLANALL